MDNFAGCIPPSVRQCDSLGCYCVTRATIPPPTGYPICTAPEVAVCQGTSCHCAAPATQDGAQPLPATMPNDGCAIVASVIVVGIKKLLVACWVNG